MSLSPFLVPRLSLHDRARNLRAWAVAVEGTARTTLEARAARLEEQATREDAAVAARRMSARAPALFRWAGKILDDAPTHASTLERAAALELRALEYEELGMMIPAHAMRRQAAYALGAEAQYLDDVPA